MGVIDEDIQRRMNNVALHFSLRIRENVARVLSQDKYANTRALAGSVRTDITRATPTSPPTINVYYRDYGDILSQRSPRWVKLPNIEKLTDWLDTKFQEGRNYVPGYAGGDASNLDRYQKVRRIAFAIAKDKLLNDTWKRKRWKREALPDVLREMNARTMEEFKSHIERLTKEAIEKGNIN